MTSIVDSEAHFSQRCSEVGLSDPGAQAVINAGFSTLGRLAFGVGQPGTAVTTQESERFANNILGGMATMRDIAALRRLVMAQLREQVSNPEAAATRKIPPVERESKMRQLKARLPGLLIQGQIEPSHALLTLVAQMWENKQLQYIPVERLTSREYEVMHSKSTKQLQIDPDKLLVKEEAKVPDQTATTELQVLEAFKRRGVAFAFIDCMSWDCHETYLQMLFSHLRVDPPEGHSRATLQQILRADRQALLAMIRKDVSARRLPSGQLQMDTALIQALESYEVSFHLVPLPKTKVADNKPGPSQQQYGPQPASSSWQQKQPTPYYKGGGKGKTKGKGKKAPNILPKELQNKGCVNQDDHGRRFCFNFNLGRCQDAANGAECSKGFHLCMKKGCHAPHSVLEHEKQKANKP